ncbi:hypothetical protein, partial [Halorubrum ezzemoulense]|uniref:hypothetical protein n=1 Tax=Halorubrum ezzemoulense TaxID=337243 RepID=UPI002330ECB4
RARSGSDERVPRQQKPSKGFESGSEASVASGTTGVQIPLRAFPLSQLRARSGSDERVPRQQKPSKGFESGSEASVASGTTGVQIPLRAFLSTPTTSEER